MDRIDFLLLQTAEEAAEVGQMASKCVRFGTHEVYKDGDGRNNIERLLDEYNDLSAMFIMLKDAGVISGIIIDDNKIEAKKEKFKKYFEYSKSLRKEKNLSRSIFEHIKHGDADHQQWLASELDKFFNEIHSAS